MQKLTKREKTLIYILICFLIIVGGWFLLLNPALEKNSKKHAEYLEVQQQLTTIQKQLIEYEQAPQQLKILEESYNEIASQYKDILSNDDIDKFLTTKVLSCGFRPVSLSIGAVSDASFKQATDDKADTKKTSGNSILKQVTINMSLNGNFNNLKKLMDTIEKEKGVEIANLSYQLSNTEKNTISLSFIMYMIQK